MPAPESAAKSYRHRVVDWEIDELFPELPALSLDGLKGVGKTTTARERARTVISLDDPDERAVLAADPSRLTRISGPVLLDEWTEWPRAWELVRHAVDEDARGGRFLLAGSATPTARIHSGAGRIVPIRIRPLTLPERKLSEPSVSLAGLLGGTGAPGGETELTLDDYIEQICRSGMPGIGAAWGWRAVQAWLDGYLERLFDHEVAIVGGARTRSVRLRQWASAYAAATATTASYEKLRDAASPGEDSKPAKTTAAEYRELLTRLWFLDPVDPWLPTSTPLKRLGQAPRHFLADPAFAARLLRVTPASLRVEAERHAPLIGQLWESLVALSVRVFAQAASASVGHLRTQGGEHEVDLIVEGEDGRVVAIEAKLAATPDEGATQHLKWLNTMLGDRVAATVLVTTGNNAYHRSDGVDVVPLALLGP